MIQSKHNAPHYTWGIDCDGWRLLNRPEFAIIHESMPAGRSEGKHMHVHARQFFFVLQGQLTMEMDGARIEIHEGQGLEIPPGRPHRAENPSKTVTEFLVISHPGTGGDRINLELTEC